MTPPRVLAPALFALLGLSCASTPSPLPSEASALGEGGSALALDLAADSPLAHWPLPGDAEGIDGSARRFVPGQTLILDGADFGGEQLAVEIWIKDARGTLLTYEAGQAPAPFGIALAESVSVSLFDQTHTAEVSLDEGSWQLLGVSWRSDTGALVVSVDGLAVLQAEVGAGQALPFDGRLMLGGPGSGGLEGFVDEAAVYDLFRDPSVWLHRHKVAHGEAAATRSENEFPVRFVVQRAHTSAVNAIDWSPDGAMIATATGEGEIKVWDSVSGALVRDLSGPDGLTDLAWSPDGTSIEATGDKNARMVWDTKGGEPLDVAGDEREEARRVFESPDGRRSALVSRKSGIIEIRQGDEGAIEHTVETEMVLIGQVVWSPDGARMAVLGCQERDSFICFVQDVQVWDVRGWTSLSRFKSHTESANAMAWHPEGGLLATVGCDTQYTTNQCETGVLKIWDADKGEQVGGLDRRSEGLVQAAWSPDGTRIAVSGEDAEVKVWRHEKGELEHTLGRRSEEIHTLTWSPDGHTLAMLSEGCRQRTLARCERASLQLWDGRSGAMLSAHETEMNKSGASAWSPDGSRLAIVGCAKSTRVKSTGVCTDGSRLQIHDAKGLRTLPYERHRHAPEALAWSPDGGTLAIAGQANVDLWGFGADKVLGGLEVRAASMAWSPKGARLVTLDEEGRAKVWDVARRVVVGELEGEHAAVVWGPGGRLATAGAGGVELWSPSGKASRRTLEAAEGCQSLVAWRADGARLAATCRDGHVRIWDLREGTVVHKLPFEGEASALSWAPEGDRLVAASNEGVRAWEAGEVLREISEAPASSRAVSWRADGAALAVGLEDRTLGVWPLVRKGRATLVSGDGQWVAFTSGGVFAASARASGLVAAVRAARAFSIDQLAPKLNRPDEVASLLGADEGVVGVLKVFRARRLARLGFTPEQVEGRFEGAPSARLLRVSAPDEGGRVMVTALFEDEGAAGHYQLYVNGVPTAAEPTAFEGRRVRTLIPVTLSAGANHIEVTATNTAGLESLRASRTVYHKGEGLPEARLYYLGFGVSDYKDDRLDLRFAHQDAMDLAESLKGLSGSYAQVVVKTWTDAQVTEAALEEARRFVSEATVHDTLIMFVAGHGVRDMDDEAHTYYYLDHDTDLDNLHATALPFASMEALLYEASPRRKLFLMDTCQSGEDLDLSALTAPVDEAGGFEARGFVKKKVGLSDDDQRTAVALGHPGRVNDRLLLAALRDRDRLIMQDLTRRSGAMVLASSLGRESSLEAPRWQNGAFTEALLEALNTASADTNKDGFVDTDELKAYVIDAVPRLTADRQHPNVERDNTHQRFALPLPEK